MFIINNASRLAQTTLGRWGGVPFLDGWTYRKSITLSRASGAVNNYQMKLLVGKSSSATGEDVDCGDHVAADFDDLRFTTSDGTTLLDYWIESISGSGSSALATVWIEFNTIGTGATTFYMYYGGTETAVSSIVNTFIFGDDFSTNTIANYTTNGGTWAISGGALTVTGVNTANSIIAPTTQSPPSAYIVDVSAKITSGYGSDAWVGTLGFQSSVASSNTGYVCQFGQTTGGEKVGIEKFTVTHLTLSAIDWAAGTYYSLQGRYSNGDLRALWNNATSASSADTTRTSGYYGLRVYDDLTGAFQNLRVRAYLATEPAWGAWGAEES